MFPCRCFQLLFCVMFVAFIGINVRCADTLPLVEDLLVNKLIAEYFQIEENLWQVIERREENTLEQIYNEHQIRLGKGHQYENFIERNRIGVDLDLAHGLKFLNETTSAVFIILKSHDFGSLNRFARSPCVWNITEALALISQSILSNELWHDVNDVSDLLLNVNCDGLRMADFSIDRMPKFVSNIIRQTTRQSIKQ